MSTVIKASDGAYTIDLTPTRAEHARVTAYILAGHAGAPVDWFGKYWELTSIQENALFATWNKLDSLNVGDFDWCGLSASLKAKLIKSLYTAILTELSKEA
jgi:hypothetical protein